MNKKFMMFRGFEEDDSGDTKIYIDNNCFIGRWVYGYYWTNGLDNHFIRKVYDQETHYYVIEDHEVIPETVCQYVGVNDASSNEIFENDLVTIPAYGGGKHLTSVYFRDGKFAVDGSNYGYKNLHGKTTKVVGNIFENPHMKECNA